MVPMKKALTGFVKFVLITVIITVIISSIAVKAISDLAAENLALQEQVAVLEQRTQESHTMNCNLHVKLLPSWDIDFLSYDIPMEFPTTWDFCNAYATGEVVPMLNFDGNYFISIYITA